MAANFIQSRRNKMFKRGLVDCLLLRNTNQIGCRLVHSYGIKQVHQYFYQNSQHGNDSQLSRKTSKVFFLIHQQQMPPQQRKFYVVVKGRTPGIYNTWPECEAQTKAFSGAVFKSFTTMQDANKYLKEETEKLKGLPIKTNDLKRTERYDEDSSSNDEGETVQKKVKPNPNQIYRQVYTDGCCFRNGSSDSMAGVGVWFGDDDPLNYSGVLEGAASNQRAEIKAASIALQLLPESENHVEILTDSKYVINAMTSWRFTWEKNSWKTAGNKEIQNLDLFLELIDLIGKRTDVKFTYVAGHTNVYGNEEADKLAKQGAYL